MSMTKKLLTLTAATLLSGCVTEKEIVYRTIYFADTNGVETTIYYPKTMEKDLRLLSSLYVEPINDSRWKYKGPKNAPDNGLAKEMKLQPSDHNSKNYVKPYKGQSK